VRVRERTGIIGELDSKSVLLAASELKIDLGSFGWKPSSFLCRLSVLFTFHLRAPMLLLPDFGHALALSRCS